ncbi:hypothetical protein D3790_04295 [Xenorhabdus nematophila]|nr:hypothetical protein D3790_04295 [Xenorhabdus nematophila]KHD27729.1 hypothetical protein LH67_15560 [Xenorhabdus nematophila]
MNFVNCIVVYTCIFNRQKCDADKVDNMEELLINIYINQIKMIYSVINRLMFLLILCFISHQIYIIFTKIIEKPLPPKKEKEAFYGLTGTL